MKKTAVAPSNIAFIKYWGRKDESLRLPSHNNISMNLSGLTTTTTVEFDAKYSEDTVIIDDIQDELESARVIEHLDRIRHCANLDKKARVVSKNNFPSGTGLSSSASGFAALTVAAAAAAGLSLHEKELSILARQGSGSACRSIPEGFVEWISGTTSETSYAYSLFPASYWKLVDIVVVASNEKKLIPTSQGQKRAWTSPFYKTRLSGMEDKIMACKKYIEKKDFHSFGMLIEREALEMHAVMITSSPPLIYWLPSTIRIINKVIEWRNNKTACYFTINTGQDVHIICEEKDKDVIISRLQTLDSVKKTIINYPCKGAGLIKEDLF